MKWVSVKERLPEYYVTVLVYGWMPNDGHVGVALAWRTEPFENEPEILFSCDTQSGWLRSITYWMEIPDKPNELSAPNSDSFRCRYCGVPEKPE